MSQTMMSCACDENGSITAVERSGMSVMSDSLIAFQPAIDEPSNMIPSVRRSSSTVRTWCDRCCHLPRGSVKRKSTYLTSFSSMRSRTFLTSDIAVDPSMEQGVGDLKTGRDHDPPKKCAVWRSAGQIAADRKSTRLN